MAKVDSNFNLLAYITFFISNSVAKIACFGICTTKSTA